MVLVGIVHLHSLVFDLLKSVYGILMIVIGL